MCVKLKLMEKNMKNNKQDTKMRKNLEKEVKNNTNHNNKSNELDEDEIWSNKNQQKNYSFYLLIKGYDSIDFDTLTDPMIPQSFIDGLKKRKEID